MLTKSKISLAFIAFMYVYIVFNISYWQDRITVNWDPSGYYLYLPAAFIYHDVGKLQFYPGITQKYSLNNHDISYGIYAQPEGMKLNKYPVGTGLFELPFFLVAHWYCISLANTPHAIDGYSFPYMESVILAGVFWVIAGLYVLRRFLRRYFSEGATAVTLLLIAFGTNLYFYTVFNTGMSHPFSFALFCFLLSATDNWYRNEKKTNAILIGLLLGLIIIVRPTNAVVALLPLCWIYTGTFVDRLRFYKRQFPTIVTAFIVFVSVLMLQLSYWKYVTGHWVYFSYQEEGFDFGSPEIWKGLFSYRKGWFVYTPVAFFGVLGLVLLAKKHKRLAALISVYLAVNIYIVFSWHQWSYGGSFGARPLIEAMAIVAIPLAILIEWLFSRNKIAITIGASFVFVFLMALNTFQSYQLTNSLTAWDFTNRAFYWRTFGKLKVTDEDRKLLNK